MGACCSLTLTRHILVLSSKVLELAPPSKPRRPLNLVLACPPPTPRDPFAPVVGPWEQIFAAYDSTLPFHRYIITHTHTPYTALPCPFPFPLLQSSPSLSHNPPPSSFLPNQYPLLSLFDSRRLRVELLGAPWRPVGNYSNINFPQRPNSDSPYSQDQQRRTTNTTLYQTLLVLSIIYSPSLLIINSTWSDSL